MEPSPERHKPHKIIQPGEVGIVQRLRRSLLALGLQERPLVLCGYSGGADSLALLAGLAELGRLGLIGVHAVYVDHGTRRESREEARVAATVAEQLGVAVAVVRIPPSNLDMSSGLGTEEVLRRARYLAFAEMFEKTGATVLALAHHQQDQAETVLLHLLRGSGIRGASGMRSFVQIKIPWWKGAPGERVPVVIPLWRPFLAESWIAVRTFAESLQVSIVEDPSNLDRTFRRNAIRHDVLPMLEEIVPGAVSSIARFAGLAGDDSDELDRQAGEALLEAGSPEVLDREWLLGFPVAIQRRIIRIWFQKLVVGVELSANRIDQILMIAQTRGRVREIQIGSERSVLVSRDALALTVPDRT